MDIAIVLALLAVATVLFCTEALSVDLVTLLLLAALVITGVLTPAEAFQGFSSELIIVLGSIFVLNGALQHAGLAAAIGERLQRVAARSPQRMLAAMMGGAGCLSAFMSNTTATALLVPPVVGVARRSRLSPSRLLLPLAYASILGGTCTLIGTSTNIAVSSYLAQNGYAPLGVFEMTPVGLTILAVGVAYMLWFGWRLLPNRPVEGYTDDYEMRESLSEIVVTPGSRLIGQRLFASELTKLNCRVLEVHRGTKRFIPNPDTIAQANDVLLVQGPRTDLVRLQAVGGVETPGDLRLGEGRLASKDIQITEALVNPRSEVIGRTLKQVGFRQRYGLNVLAIHRKGESLRDKLADLRLQLGDVLLVQGSAGRLELFRHDPDFAILAEVPADPQSRRRTLQIGLLLGGALAVGTAGLMPLSISLLLAAVLTVALRWLPLEKAYEFIDWRLLILVGGLTAFGQAMAKTGAAEFLAHGVVTAFGPWGPRVVLGAFLLLTVVLTQPMSNAAAALVVLPVALQTALDLGVNPRTFAVGVMLAASISLIAPMEPSCILVYGPGKYRFRDFVRAGSGLTLLLVVLVLVLTPVFWPLQPEAASMR